MHVKKVGLTNEGGHPLHKQAHDRRGIVESLHAPICRAKHMKWACFIVITSQNAITNC